MRVAVAGGTGFIGRHVVAALRARGDEATTLARGTRPQPGDDALVNLVGIKHEQGGDTFESAHVDVTRRLLAACREAGIRRYVHISVVCSRPDAESPYHDTKWRAEELVRGSGLDFTILRPAVVYGPGDDMVTHLVRMIRFIPLFPVVGSGDSLLQPVDVRDVAEAVALALERPATAGCTYDIVGPTRFALREVVRTVAEGAGLPVLIVPTPLALQRVAVRVMDAVMTAPLSTPAQLRMLVEGLYGDPAPARRELGLVPRPFTAAAVRALESAVGPLFGVSLRLVDGRRHAEWLARRRPAFGAALALLTVALVLSVGLAPVLPNVWYRMAAAALMLSIFALAGVEVGWRELFRPSLRHLALGAAAAVLLYGAGAAIAGLLAASPVLAAQMATLYGWKSTVPAAMAMPLVVFIVLGEEIVWRNAVTLPLAARLGSWTGVIVAALAFAAAHVSLGLPVLLLAAFGAGAFWSALVVKTRSAVPALLCHILWDMAVLFWLPYLHP